MRYLSELLACSRIKQPVQAYIYTDASEEHAPFARKLCESVALEMQKRCRVSLSKYSAWASAEQIIYSKDEDDAGIIAHENWHKYINKFNIDSCAGDFIEEASASVIEHTASGDYRRFVGISWRHYIPLYLLVQRTKGEDLEQILSRFGKGILPSWDESVMAGSCNWLWFLSDAQYFLLYDLCFDVCAQKGIKSAKKIFRRSLETAKKYGVQRGVTYLKRRASPEIAKLYDFEFDIGGYLPKHPIQADMGFFNGELKIEAYAPNESWIRELKREIKARGLKEDEKKS